MTNFITHTPAEFAIVFPRARGRAGAIRFVSCETSPKTIVHADDVPVAPGERAIEVGYTNASRSRKVTRFAIVAV